MDDCITDKHPRIKKVIDEHEGMKMTIAKLEPAIVNLTTAVDRLHENHNELVLHVDKNVSKAVGAIWAAGGTAVIICALVSYIYLTDQKQAERAVMLMMGEHKVMQEQIAKGIERDSRSAAERELLFKALLQAINKK